MRTARTAIATLAVAFVLTWGGAPVSAATSGPPPGAAAADPAVTQATVASTVCRSGYTKTVRNVSNATKSSIYAAYGVAQAKKRLYVIDHLIPLEVGGSNATANLWPQLKADAKKKDVLENLVHARLCAGTLDLATAQRAFTTKFSTLPPTAAAPPAAEPPPATDPPATEPPATEAPAPQTEAPVAPGGGATARCNDGTYSYAAHHQGACSSHGGVAEFYK